MPRKLFVSERIQLNDAALCRGGIDLWVFKPLVLNAAKCFPDEYTNGELVGEGNKLEVENGVA